jgi:hypothetical protein
MAKAILEFDLNDPDDRMEHRRAVQSVDLALALWEIHYNTRKSVELTIEEREMKGEKEMSAYDAMWLYSEKIAEAMKRRNIDIDQLIE